MTLPWKHRISYVQDMAKLRPILAVEYPSQIYLFKYFKFKYQWVGYKSTIAYGEGGWKSNWYNGIFTKSGDWAELKV